MSEEAPANRDDAMLAEQAELTFAATRRAHERLMAAEDDAAFHEAGRTFQRLSRSLRQTLALKSKLSRDGLAHAREAREVAVSERERRVEALKAEVHAAVERVIWDEHEREDYPEFHFVELDERLEELAEADDFLATPAAVHIARLRADLGLPPDDERADEPRPPEPAPESSG